MDLFDMSSPVMNLNPNMNNNMMNMNQIPMNNQFNNSPNIYQQENNQPPIMMNNMNNPNPMMMNINPNPFFTRFSIFHPNNQTDTNDCCYCKKYCQHFHNYFFFNSTFNK